MFDSSQLTQIKRVTLARALCDNGDDINRVQSDVFSRVSHLSGYAHCSSVPGMDLRFWKECCGGKTLPYSPHLTSPHLTSPHLTSPHLTSPHLTSPHLTSPHLTSPHLTLPHLTSLHFTSPHLTSPHLTLLYLTLSYFVFIFRSMPRS